MPPKVRELEADLKREGFTVKHGKGSHRKYSHVLRKRIITISGSPGDDAKDYQEKAVVTAIAEVRRQR